MTRRLYRSRPSGHRGQGEPAYPRGHRACDADWGRRPKADMMLLHWCVLVHVASPASLASLSKGAFAVAALARSVDLAVPRAGWARRGRWTGSGRAGVRRRWTPPGRRRLGPAPGASAGKSTLSGTNGPPQASASQPMSTPGDPGVDLRTHDVHDGSRLVGDVADVGERERLSAGQPPPQARVPRAVNQGP